jgi:hypothetical protein
LVLAGAAQADVVYDAVSGYTPPQLVYLTGVWVAEDAHLVGGAGQPLASVEVLTRLSSSDPQTSFTGSITVALMTSITSPTAGIIPGSVIASRTIPVTWLRAVDTPLTVDLSGVMIPSDDVWVAYMVANGSGQPQNQGIGTPFVCESTSPPTVGTTTSGVGISTNDVSGPWSRSSDHGMYWAVAVNTVPGPGAGAVLVAAALARRRNRS